MLANLLRLRCISYGCRGDFNWELDQDTPAFLNKPTLFRSLWEMIDHFLSSLLFILIGLAILLIHVFLARVNLNFPCYSSVLNLSLCKCLVAIQVSETLP